MGRSYKHEAHREKKKTKKAVLAAGILLGVLVLILAALAVFVLTNLSRFQDVAQQNTGVPVQDADGASADPNLPDLGDDDLNSLKAPGSQATAPEGVYQIMLYGVDTRDKNEFTGSRSDVMLLATMDTRNNSVKLTSFMRDILVPIPEHGYNRLNSAYTLGGPKLATQVIANQFGVKIEDYAVVNFWSTASIIDLVSGVDVDVKSDEIEQINRNIDEMNKLDSSQNIKPVTKAGLQHLTGAQAVAYMRIRKVGTDFERTQRQRTVLTNMAKGLSKMDLTQALQLVQVLPQYMRTNLSQTDMAGFANAAYTLRGAAITQLRIPVDGSYSGANYQGMIILKVNFEENAQKLKDFLQLS